MKKMTIEEALEVAISLCDEMVLYAGITEIVDKHKQAAEILRNMAEEPALKKSDESSVYFGFGRCKTSWTETRVLKIVTEKSDVKFEKVD